MIDRRLRVLVNARAMVPGETGGLEGSFRATLQALGAEGEERVHLTILTSYHNHDALRVLPGVECRYVPEEQRETLLAGAEAGQDVLWCPFFFLEPEAPGLPAVVTIPDLLHEELPELFPRELLAYRIRAARLAATRARVVLTHSETSRVAIRDRFHLQDDRVVAAPHDCDPVFRVAADPGTVAALRARFALPERYVLFPANDWPHKNHRTLFQAWRAFAERHGPPPLLALTGARTRDGADLEALARAEGVSRWVRHLGFVAKTDLPHLYDGAAALAYVTLFEGFGIPLLEAMRRGTPILGGRAGSIPELAGDAALLVDPRDPAAIVAGLHTLLAEPAATRARVEQGRARVTAFDDRAAGARVLAALHRAASERGSQATTLDPAYRPKVFVVTPSYQQAEFLRATIDSVLAQDYPNLEYRVADGGSTDGSVAILESYGDRVRWCSAPDGGQAAAIANAWRATDAEIVAWLNSDDTYLPGAVTAAVDWLLAHPECAMVYGDAWYTDRAGERRERYATRAFDRERLRRECFICQPAAFVRREVFAVVDLPDPRLRYALDYDLWIRLSESFGIGHLARDLATSRMYPTNKTLGERDGVYREIFAVTRRHYGSVPRPWREGRFWHRAKTWYDRVRWLLPRRLQKWLYRAWMERLQQRGAPPPYSDGWVGRRSSHHVRLETPHVVIECESPEWPHARPLHVRLRLEGQTLVERTVGGRGPFRLEADAPGLRLAPVRLELEANRTFLDPLGRAVAFRVTRIGAELAS